MPEPDAVAVLREFMAAHPRCGVAGPQLVDPDGALAAIAAPVPHRRAARSSGARRCAGLRPPLEHQRDHYHSTSVPTEPVEADWMLGGFLMLRRAMLDELGGFDEGFRLYGEDIDLCYRAAKAGWERWYVPGRRRASPLGRGRRTRRFFTRRTLWHWRGILRFVRKHPERLQGLCDDARSTTRRRKAGRRKRTPTRRATSRAVPS